MNRRVVVSVVSLALASLLVSTSGSSAQAPVGLDAVPPPVDPQSWALPEWLTWDDYQPIPGVDWNDPQRQAARPLRAALVMADFADRDFVVTLPEGGDVFARDGLANPNGIGSIPRGDVGDFYADLLVREPSALNFFHTINEYWLEDSYGVVGVDAEAFGPYRLEGNEHEYGLTSSDAGGDGTEWEPHGPAGNHCPSGDSCDRDVDTEMLEASLADVTAGIASNGEDYDFRYLLHAGYDESGVWQEFGEMLFESREDVPDNGLGNPDPALPDWVDSRYQDRWTAFAAGEGIWSHAIPGVFSTQGENDGSSVFAHELSHIFGVLDNYNDPYGVPVRRSYSGPWDMLSRGAFNGPGGPHTRWLIPANQGASMGSHHMLRNKLRLGFSQVGRDVMAVQRDALATTGPVFVDLWPRAYPLAPVTGEVGLHGLQIAMGEDHAPECRVEQDYRCDGGGYGNYTIEVVEQIGHDSFTHDSGVLIAKTKDAVDLAPFIHVQDAHPGDINAEQPVGRFADREVFDFVRPGSGEQVPISLGDYRQLSDALFHAGTGEGVVSEFVDEANRLHVYVLEQDQPEGQAVPTYRVAVRSLDGAGPLPRAVVAAAATPGTASPGRVAEATFTVTNPGAVAELYRLTPALEPAGACTPVLRHLVVEVQPGETLEVPVHVVLPLDAAGASSLTLTATSEMDAAATATASTTVTAVGTAAKDAAACPGPGGGPPIPVPVEQPVPVPEPPDTGPEITRVAGDNRIETAVAVSETAYPDGARTVTLARSDDYPDALTGAPLALALGGPLLLTGSDALPEQTATELERLDAGTVVLLGGTDAISEGVAEDLRARGLAVERVGGGNRFATAAAVAERLGPAATAFVASGRGFADALSAAPFAAFLGRPILLTEPAGLPPETRAALAARDVTEAVVLGGPAAVADSVVAELEAAGHGPRRLAGADRYATSVAIGDEAIASGMAATRLWLATGLDWPDALAAGPAVAALGDTFLLVHGQDLTASPATEQALRERAEALDTIRLVGGPAAIAETVADQIRETTHPPDG